MTLETLMEIGRQEGIPTIEENNKLAIRAKTDPEALDQLLRKNLLLILKYVYGHCANGSIEDMFQDGVIGFLHAVEYYDETKGAFSTYLNYRVQACISKANARTETFYYPQNFYQKIVSYQKFHKKMEALEIQEEDVTDEELDSHHLTRRDLDNILKYTRSHTSLERLYADAKERDGYFDVADPNANTEDEAMATVVQEQIQKELARILTAREHLILCSYYGIGYDHPFTNDETEQLMKEQFGSKSTSRSYLQAVRQKAINKLKGNRKLKSLASA